MRKTWKRLLAGILCAAMIAGNGPLYTMAAAVEPTEITETEPEDTDEAVETPDGNASGDGEKAQPETGEDQASGKEDTPEQEEKNTSATAPEQQEQADADDAVALANESQGAKEAGTFVLAASCAAKNLIVPVRISYEAGDTIWTALEKSGYSFERDGSSGFIRTIEGTVGNYRIWCSDENYELNRSPENVSVVEFSEMESYSASRTALLKRMVEFQEMDNNVQNWWDASKAYEAAVSGYRSANETEAAKLLGTLNASIQSYEDYLKGDRVTVTVHATRDGEEVTDLHLKFWDIFENVYETDGNTIEIPASTEHSGYGCRITDAAGYDVYGSPRLTEWIDFTEDTTIEAKLPSGEWSKNVQVLSDRTDSDGDAVAYETKTDAKTHTIEAFVDDRAGKGGSKVVLYAEEGPDLPKAGENGVKYISAYFRTEEEDVSQYNPRVEIPFGEGGDVSKYLTPGMNGAEGRYWVEESQEQWDSEYTRRQAWIIRFTRVPTADITLKDAAGNSLLEAFDAGVTEYNASTVEDFVTIDAVPFGTDGYSVQYFLDDAAITDKTITLHTGDNVVKVQVSHTNGQSRTYVFHIKKVIPVETTLTADDGVVVKVYNFNEEEVEPKNGVYQLIPGSQYSYRASIDDTYFATEKFLVTDDGTHKAVVKAATPEKKDALTDFAMYTETLPGKRSEYTPEKVFAQALHSVSYLIPDNNKGVSIQASPLDGYKVRASWIQQTSDGRYNGKTAEQSSIPTVDREKNSKTLNYVLENGGYGNTVTLRLEKTTAGVTRYQDYTVEIRRSVHLKSLAASTLAGDVNFTNDAGEPIAFAWDTTEYNIVVPSGVTSLNLAGQFIGKGSDDAVVGGYSVQIGKKTYTDLSDLSVTLRPARKDEDIEITVKHKDTNAEETIYTIHVKKREMVKVRFEVKPAEATVFVKNQVDGSEVFPENGVYSLMPDVAYTYHVTLKGYKGVQVKSFTVSEDQTVQIELEKADSNDTIKNLPAQWPSFRDENNNAVLDSKTPIKDEDAVLYWANDDSFDGYCGHPILVNGYLYTYDNTNLLKLDTVTGELVQRGGALIRKSSFSIQPPTYGDGMIFVGLSNGTIQAFNADTMESLWVYEDELGGQPNCQITYRNGYIYTGFWNNEDKTANYVCISATDEDPTRGDEEKVATWTHAKVGGYYWAGAYISDSGDFMLEGTDDGEGGYLTGHAQVLSINPKTGETIDSIEMPFVGDIRSNITHDTKTGDYFFTSKGGYFYRVSVDSTGHFVADSLKYIKLENGGGETTPAMSTSTPTIYNGRAYIGVAGRAQFGQYVGHSIAVIDLDNMKVAYYVPTQGYPQTSGVLTKGYDQGDGTVYVYFFDNMTPGKLRVIEDKPGQTKATLTTTEELYGYTYETGYVLFTPSGVQAQYALCNPIVDEYGTLYFRNDSNYMMALGSTITELRVASQPDKTTYKVGEKFNSAGLKVEAVYKNGAVRDVTKYVTYSTENLKKSDENFVISFDHVMYQNKDGAVGVSYKAPTTSLSLTIKEDGEDTGVTVSGTATSWDNKANLSVCLYSAEISDEDIRTDMWKEAPEKALSYGATLGDVASGVDGKRYGVTYQLTGVPKGEYKLAIAKPGKYVVKVVPITVGDTKLDMGVQKLWKYGDVTDDGKISTADALEIRKYSVHKNSILSQDDEKEERQLAANVTAPHDGDKKISTADALEIRKNAVHKKSVFDSMP